MALLSIDWRPGRRQLRLFGLATAGAMAAAGAWLHFRHSLPAVAFSVPAAQRAAMVLWGLAAASAALAAFHPPALRPLYVALNLAAFPIGLAVSYVLMAVLFYALFTPMAVLFRLIGRDALHRRFDPNAESYWIPLEKDVPPSRYFRQF